MCKKKNTHTHFLSLNMFWHDYTQTLCSRSCNSLHVFTKLWNLCKLIITTLAVPSERLNDVETRLTVLLLPHTSTPGLSPSLMLRQDVRLGATHTDWNVFLCRRTKKMWILFFRQYNHWPKLDACSFFLMYLFMYFFMNFCMTLTAGLGDLDLNVNF